MFKYFCLENILPTIKLSMTAIQLQTQAGWAFQKDSPYLEAFNHHLTHILMTGIADRLMHAQVSTVKLGYKKIR